MHRSLATSAFLVSGLLFAAPPALAQERTKRDGGNDVPAPGLTSAERKAMDLRGMTVTSDGDGLVVVDLRFAGDLGATFGRGQLRRAIAGIVVRPAKGKPTTVATAGSAQRPEAGKRGPGSVVVVNRGTSTIRFVLTGIPAPRSVFAAAIANPSRKGLKARAAFDPFGMTMLQILSESEDRKIQQRNDFLRMAGITPRPLTCPELRRLRAKLLRERDELRIQRELADTPSQRTRVQEAINTLDIRLDDIERQISVACGGSTTPPANDPGGPPEAFSTSWAHGTGRSRICVYVSGAPGASGDVTIDGTDSPRVQPFTLDGSGRATVEYEIGSYGTYPVGVRWGQSDGSSTTKNGSVTVDENNGPAAPEGYSACPAPA